MSTAERTGASRRQIEQALEAAIADGRSVRVLRRSTNMYASTFPSEVFRCLIGAEQVDVLCKYDLDWARDVRGFPAGVRYEAHAYREAVQPSGLSAPRFFGTCTGGIGKTACLLVEYVPDAFRVSKAPETDAVVRAASWIGSFHRYHDGAGRGLRHNLNRHDAAYFGACARRTIEYSAPLLNRLPWLPELANYFEREAVPVLRRRPTVIHGDFYPANVLVKSSSVYPVDWELAAISAGEIDLAALLEGHWSDVLVAMSLEAYADARWLSQPPPDFGASLAASRMYLHFRALGDAPEEPYARWRFDQLADVARTVGLL